MQRFIEGLTARMQARSDALATYRCLRAQRKALLQGHRPSGTSENALPVSGSAGTAEWAGNLDGTTRQWVRVDAVMGAPIDPQSWDKCTLDHCYKSWALAAAIKWALLTVGAIGMVGGHPEVTTVGGTFAALFQVFQTSAAGDLARGLQRLRHHSGQPFESAAAACTAEPRTVGATAKVPGPT
jgi:hypothetical protein